MIPSLARSSADFDQLGTAIALRGFTAAALDQRGIGDSRGPLQGFDLTDLADDVAALADALGSTRVVVIGHAFGNGIARRMAALYPSLVIGVVAIAAGGKIHDPDPNVYGTFSKIFDPSVGEDTRLAAIAESFFADGVVPPDWVDRWWPKTYRPFIDAGDATSMEDWWAAGSASILVIQGLQDRVAPPDNGYDLKLIAGDRASVVDLDGASHALLPEKPQEIENAVMQFLNELSD